MEKFYELLNIGIHDTGEARTLAYEATELVNSLTVDTESIAKTILQDRGIAGTFLPFAYAWVEKLSKMYIANQFDARNRYSCLVGYKLMADNGIAKLAKGSSGMSVLNAFCELMSREHRTLQQQFSSVVFYFICQNLIEDACWQPDSFESLGLPYPDFCEVPMI